jgi:hypothetical protein
MIEPLEASELTGVEIDAEGRFVSIGVKATSRCRPACQAAENFKTKSSSGLTAN